MLLILDLKTCVMISSSKYLWEHIPIFACRIAKGVQTIFSRLNSGNTKRVFTTQIVRRIRCQTMKRLNRRKNGNVITEMWRKFDRSFPVRKHDGDKHVSTRRKHEGHIKQRYVSLCHAGSRPCDKVGGGHPDPLDKGGGGVRSPKTIFRPSSLSLV